MSEHNVGPMDGDGGVFRPAQIRAMIADDDRAHHRHVGHWHLRLGQWRLLISVTMQRPEKQS